MKHLMPEISPQIIKNKSGKQIGVFMEIKDYKLLMERIEDLYLGNIAKLVKKKKTKTTSLKVVEKKLKAKRKSKKK